MRARTATWMMVPLATAVAVAFGTACDGTSDTSTTPVANQALLQVYKTTTLPNNEPLPAVVARLGDATLSGSDFAERVAEVTYNDGRANVNESQAEIRTAALEGWLRQAALHERAKAEGIAVTDAEVAAYISQERAHRHAVLASDAQTASDYQAYIEARGYTNADDYDRDPRAIQAARWILEAQKLFKRDLSSSSTQSQQEVFVQATMAQARSTLKTFVRFN